MYRGTGAQGAEGMKDVEGEKMLLAYSGVAESDFEVCIFPVAYAAISLYWVDRQKELLRQTQKAG